MVWEYCHCCTCAGCFVLLSLSVVGSLCESTWIIVLSKDCNVRIEGAQGLEEKIEVISDLNDNYAYL